MICLSMGAEGSRVYCEEKRIEAAAHSRTEGYGNHRCGRHFLCLCAECVLDHGLEGWSEDELVNMLTFANAAASIGGHPEGALRVMRRNGSAASKQD